MNRVVIMPPMGGAGGVGWVGGNWTGAPFLACGNGRTNLFQQSIQQRIVFVGMMLITQKANKPRAEPHPIVQ